LNTQVDALLDEHERAGQFIDVGGVRTFVRDEGTGAVPVVCVHGVPVSSFLWRKVLPELAARGLRGVAPDLPGLGLSDRPADFDYSWTGLGRHLSRTLDTLGIARYHLVVHDIGGPVGFEVAAHKPDRVASLTLLNTMVDANRFRRPGPMKPFAWPVVDRWWLQLGQRGPLFRLLMRHYGLLPDSSTTDAEIAAHQQLQVRGDGGRAFLKIMKGFETTRAKTDLYAGVVSTSHYPVQVLWGEDDPGLTLRKYGAIAARMAGIAQPTPLPGRHFFQEDSAPAIADHIHRLAERVSQETS
jgi:haloalkane dehalogenase